MTNYIPLKRRHDWSTRFTEFIAESLQMGVQLDWEHFSCASWVADGVLEMTGTDLYEPFRELDMTNPLGAYKAIKAAGYDNLTQLVEDRLPPRGLAFIRRGDIVLAPAGSASGLQASPSNEEVVDWDACGMPHAICLAAPPIAWALTPEGLGRFSLSAALKGFAVG